MLCNNGFAEVWNYPESVDPKMFIPIFKQRIIDCYIQKWTSNKGTRESLSLYNNCKIHFDHELYLEILPKSLRVLITRFKMSAHSLRIQTGRYARNKIPRNERYCQCCNYVDIEDEYYINISMLLRFATLSNK